MSRNLRLRVGQGVLPAPVHRLNGYGTQAQCQWNHPNHFLTEPFINLHFCPVPVISHIRATASIGTHMSDSTLCQETKQPKLLDQVRQYLRLHHYSIHTKRSYVDWIVRFIRFHRMRSRDDLFPTEPKIEVFLTHLAMEGNVAPATQNQAMNALVFLYKRVLRQAMEGSINAVRADRKVNVPGVGRY